MVVKLLVFLAIGMVVNSVLCALLANGTGGYQIGSFRSYGLWRACLDGVCGKYGNDNNNK